METKGINTTTPSPVDLKTTRADKADANQAEKRSTAVTPDAGKSNYEVSLSSRAKELAEARRKATEIARQTPDVREDKVADLKRRIKNGEYQMDSAKIADGMMQEAIKDELATKMHEEAKSR